MIRVNLLSPVVMGLLAFFNPSCNKEKGGSNPSEDQPIPIAPIPVVPSDCDALLMQSDFDKGTYMIESPGTYCLGEDISFDPNSPEMLREQLEDESITAYESSRPLKSQLGFIMGEYSPAAFGLGFFAAIAVDAQDVTIDLKGYRLEQSKRHALLQRFYANIEAADRPFIKGQGPHDFGKAVGSADGLTIKNGTIGRSSHHGIHGNRAKNVTIENVKFEDFEVAAVALNGVDGLTLKNLSASSRRDVPVLGQFSTALFIRPYVDFLAQSGSKTEFKGKSASQIQAKLKSSINKVYDDLIIEDRGSIDQQKNPEEYRMFHNPTGVVDGNAYGFLINGVGVAVNGFPLQSSTDSPSKNIEITNVTIEYLEANIREIIPVVAEGDTAKHAKDPIGSIFQLLAVDPQGQPLALDTLSPASAGRYMGNVVTDAQALVAKAAANKEFPFFLDVSRNSISKNLVDWAESGEPLSNYLASAPGPHGTGFLCNGDQMFHSNKGVVGFKLDGGSGIWASKIRVKKILNTGKAGSDLCGAYTLSHPGATLEGYGGAAVRGVSVSGSSSVSLTDVTIEDARSAEGSVIGIDIMTDSSGVSMSKIETKRLEASKETNTAPTESPEAIGVKVSADAGPVSLFSAKIKGLTRPAGASGATAIKDESGELLQ